MGERGSAAWVADRIFKLMRQSKQKALSFLRHLKDVTENALHVRSPSPINVRLNEFTSYICEEHLNIFTPLDIVAICLERMPAINIALAPLSPFLFLPPLLLRRKLRCEK